MVHMVPPVFPHRFAPFRKKFSNAARHSLFRTRSQNFVRKSVKKTITEEHHKYFVEVNISEVIKMTQISQRHKETSVYYIVHFACDQKLRVFFRKEHENRITLKKLSDLSP